MDFDVVVLGLLTPVRRGRRCALHPYIMGDVVVTWFCPIRPIGDQVPSKRPRRQVFLRGREDDVDHDDDGHHNEPDGDDDDGPRRRQHYNQLLATIGGGGYDNGAMT